MSEAEAEVREKKPVKLPDAGFCEAACCINEAAWCRKDPRGRLYRYCKACARLNGFTPGAKPVDRVLPSTFDIVLDSQRAGKPNPKSRRARPVEEVNDADEVIDRWDSITSLLSEVGVLRQSLINALRLHARCQGRRFRYANEPGKESE